MASRRRPILPDSVHVVVEVGVADEEVDAFLRELYPVMTPSFRREGLQMVVSCRLLSHLTRRQIAWQEETQIIHGRCWLIEHASNKYSDQPKEEP
jgi:hypothetical protein